MNGLPERHYRISGRQVAAVAGVPIFVGPGVLVIMVIGALPKLAQGLIPALFTAAAIFVAILAHEAAHAIAGHRRGLRPEVVSIGQGAFVFFAGATTEQLGVSVYAAGAICNLAIAAVLAAMAFAIVPDGRGKVLLDAAVQVNLLFGVANLMPAYSNDGGHIGCLLLGRIMPRRWALTTVGAIGLLCEVLSFVMLVVLAVMGWPLVWGGGGSSLELLRWAWRKPPPTPRPPTDRLTPAWLIRREPEATGEGAPKEHPAVARGSPS